MILESKGTPSIVVKICDDLKSEVEHLILINGGKINKLINEADVQKTSRDRVRTITLKCNLLINIIPKNSYGGDINYNSCISSDFNNCVINIYFNNDKDVSKCLRSLSHELHHLFELYQIKDFFDKTSWVKSNAVFELKKLISNNSIVYFIELCYLSLSHEVNSRVSSIYTSLHLSKPNDIDKFVSNTREYEFYKTMSDFDPNDYFNHLNSTNDEEFILSSFNLINVKMGIDEIINNMEQLKSYLDKFKIYLDRVSKKYLLNIERSVKRYKESLNEEYECIEEYTDNPISYEKTRIQKLEEFSIYTNFIEYMES